MMGKMTFVPTAKQHLKNKTRFPDEGEDKTRKGTAQLNTHTQKEKASAPVLK